VGKEKENGHGLNDLKGGATKNPAMINPKVISRIVKGWNRPQGEVGVESYEITTSKLKWEGDDRRAGWRRKSHLRVGFPSIETEKKIKNRSKP